jgi:hypothetical protein
MGERLWGGDNLAHITVCTPAEVALLQAAVTGCHSKGDE